MSIFRKTATVLGIAAALACGAAQGAVVQYSFEDDDADFILDPITLQPITSGNLAVGQLVVSTFELPSFTIGGNNAIPTGQELTGVSVLQIASITDANPATVGILEVGSVITYEASPDGLNAILGLGTSGATVTGGDAGDGATIAMFFNDGTTSAGVDPDRNLIFDQSQLGGATNCTSLSDCITQASLGTLFQVDGFTGDADEVWFSVQVLAGGSNIGTVLGTNVGLTVQNFNAVQGTIFNSFGPIASQDIGTGLQCAAPNPNPAVADGCITGGVLSGSVIGGAGLVNGAFAHSDFQGTKLQAVPEPGTLILLAAGLLGFAGTRKLRRTES